MNPDQNGPEPTIHLLFGYDALVVNFEPFLREYISERILRPAYGIKWEVGVPESVVHCVMYDHGIEEASDLDVDQFLEETGLMQLGQVLLKKENFDFAAPLIGSISRERLVELMDSLCELRDQMARSDKQGFGEIGFDRLMGTLRELCSGPAALRIIQYINDAAYKKASTEIPDDFFDESGSYIKRSVEECGIRTAEDRTSYDLVIEAKKRVCRNEFQDVDSHFEKALEMSPSLPCVRMEYSKYLFDRGQESKAIKMALSAVEFDQEDPQAWLNIGILYRRIYRVHDAVECIRKACELDPEDRRMRADLGRIYAIDGQCENAEKEYRAVLEDGSVTDAGLRRQLSAWRADNFLEWFKQIPERKDMDGYAELLATAIDAVNEAMELSNRSDKVWSAYRAVCKEAGIAYAERGDFESAKKYFLKSIEIVKTDQRIFASGEDLTCEVYYRLASNAITFGCERAEIASYISKGLFCSPDSEAFKEAIKKLQKELAEHHQTVKKTKMVGKIRFYNRDRRFGVIDDPKGEDYIFLPSSFLRWISNEDIHRLVGTEVEFVPFDNPKHAGKRKACEIVPKGTAQQRK